MSLQSSSSISDRDNPYSIREFWLFAAATVLYFTWFAWHLVYAGSDSIRLASAISVDEGNHARLLKNAIDESTFDLQFENYGHLSFNLALVPLWLFSSVAHVSEQTIIVALRLVSVVCAVATVLATFALARQCFGSLAAWLAGFLFATQPLEFLYWSVTSHPDVPQLFFLVLSLYFCCRLAVEPQFRHLLKASGFAGAAFSAKYSGLFLLPIIWLILTVQTMTRRYSRRTILTDAQSSKLALFLPLVVGVLIVICGLIASPSRYLEKAQARSEAIAFVTWVRGIVVATGGVSIFHALLRVARYDRMRDYRPASRFSQLFVEIILAMVTFGATFLLTSPFSLMRLSFLQGMIQESRKVSLGHHLLESRNGLLWLYTLLSPRLLNEWVLSLASISLGLTVICLFKKGPAQQELLGWEVAVWAWTILYFTFLILCVNFREPHYLLPIVPTLIIVAAHPITQVVSRFKRAEVNPWMTKTASVVVVLVVCLLVPNALVRGQPLEKAY